MNKDNVRQFNGDKKGKRDILEYCVDYFNGRILEEAYKGGDVRAIATAVVEIKKAFEQMDIDYAIPTQPTEQINEAR